MRVRQKFALPALALLAFSPLAQSASAAGNVIQPTLPVTCVASNEASARACITQLSSAGTGGIVKLPAAMTITSSLPAVSNIVYQGATPNGTPQSVDPGDNWDVGTAGTLITCGGGGGYPMIAAKTTPLGSPDSGTTAIYNFGLENVTLNGASSCTYGVQVGAANSFGLFHSHLSQVWFTGFTTAAFDIENTGFDQFDGLYVRNSNACGFFIDSLPTATYNPTNSNGRRWFCYSVGNHMRGFVFQVTNSTGIMGALSIDQLQVNNFANSLNTQAATMSNGSTSVGVTDLSQYDVGMPVAVSATANGFKVGRGYFVLSKSASTGAGTITLGSSSYGSAISATGSTALNIVTYGWSQLEILNPGGAAQILAMSFTNLDLEGNAGCTIHAEGTATIMLSSPAQPSVASASNVCATNSTLFMQWGYGSWTTDLEGTAGSSSMTTGSFGAFNGNNGFGIYRNQSRVTNVLMLSGRDSGGLPDLESVPLSNASYLKASNASIGQFTSFNNGTSGTLNAGNAGVMNWGGSIDGSFTMPTIANSSPASSNLGIIYEPYNPTTHYLTIAGASGQYFGGISGNTTLVLKPGYQAILNAAQNSSSAYQWAGGVISLIEASAAPTIGASCGTGATLATGATIGSGTLTVGTAPTTGCTLTWPYTLARAPVCQFTDEAGSVPPYSPPTTTAATLNATGLAAHVIDYRCSA